MEPLAKMQSIAVQMGGKCLSMGYKNNKKKLRWQCEKGHKWDATPFSINIRKSWCPICAGNRPLGMEYMHDLAQSRGGMCLSAEYFNIITRMLWQCHSLHIFESTPENVKQGRWCPICLRIKL